MNLDIFLLAIGVIGLVIFFIGLACDSDGSIGFGWLCMVVSIVYFAGPHLIAFLWHWATSKI